MYRRYYRYNDPVPSAAPRRTPPPSNTPMPSGKSTLSLPGKLLAGTEKDDLLLIGLLLLFLLGEQEETDFYMILALLYILLQK